MPIQSIIANRSCKQNKTNNKSKNETEKKPANSKKKSSPKQKARQKTIATENTEEKLIAEYNEAMKILNPNQPEKTLFTNHTDSSSDEVDGSNFVSEPHQSVKSKPAYSQCVMNPDYYSLNVLDDIEEELREAKSTLENHHTPITKITLTSSYSNEGEEPLEVYTLCIYSDILVIHWFVEKVYTDFLQLAEKIEDLKSVMNNEDKSDQTIRKMNVESIVKYISDNPKLLQHSLMVKFLYPTAPKKNSNGEVFSVPEKYFSNIMNNKDRQIDSLKKQNGLILRLLKEQCRYAEQSGLADSRLTRRCRTALEICRDQEK